MELVEILRMRGLDLSKPTKMLRHQHQGYVIRDLYRRGFLEEYQAVQTNDILGKCEQVVSFLGMDGTRALFVGVWRVVRGHPARKLTPSAGYPYPEMFTKPLFRYDAERLAGFEDLRDRLVIDWGSGTRSWHQWLSGKTRKPVLELLPKGYAGEFPGYLEVVLPFPKLRQIIENPEAHRTWYTMLRSAAGVYLITTGTGEQYVGAAYGEHGFLGRWQSYARTGHGGNKQLKELLTDDPACKDAFQFSILRTLPIGTPANEVIEAERTLKIQLGSRAHGLNSN